VNAQEREVLKSLVQIVWMRLLLALAMDKGHLNPPAMRYVRAIATRLQFDKEGLDALIGEVRKLPGQR
jgi:hypothetical protein